ncbi:hypothetical protein [Stakelama tenebrarum]|uniref:Uncharacterized protein n=1 Tax=Stakelama tenebrarum TaxID=2711215 RepID=A0A6G6Y9L7_9SPHN|nr:hypothetical protein [Sphingosinithalassobacter tenebrarum]QIG81634.1 hypothetical protein G5C33_18800 [Sphingosinithalassobacter tenebrarum]
MTRRGRPLRFLALVCTGWVGLRIAILWHATGSLPQAIEAVVPVAALAAPTAHPAPDPATGQAPASVSAGRKNAATPPPPTRLRPSAPDPFDPARAQLAMAVMVRYGDPEYVAGAPQTAPSPSVVPATAPPSLGWSGALWVLRRGNGVRAAAPGAAQLGGGQAGIRVAYRAGPRGALALAGRLTAPLEGQGREATMSVEWQPTRLPVRIVAERRVALDGGADGTGAGIIAGTQADIPAGFRLEAYGQAGGVLRDRLEPYADGAVRVLRPVRRRGKTQLSLGAGAWGGAQRGIARVDIGPAAVIDFPAGDKHLRLAFEWRERIAGNALPGSGLAVTLGADF